MIFALLLALAADEPPLRTSITVTAPIATETPASISVLNSSALLRLPGVNLDDRLRAVPGFSLFRRSSSLAANPTTQGVSLRGIGSTGASRTLVLWDGVPLNDPFGGWVYWTRVSPAELDRVEISRGASTSVFGDRAMSGAVALFSREPERRRLTASYEGGNRNTHSAEAGYSHLWRTIGASAHGRAFTTDGYFIVPESYRGAVDTRANVRFVAADARLDYLGSTHRAFVKLDMIAEDRANGTVLQRNSTTLGNLAAHYAYATPRHTLSVIAFHTRAEYRQSFSSIAADRNSERLTALQSIPSDSTGAAALYQRPRFVLGADTLRVHALIPVSRDLLQHAVFAQANLPIGPFTFYAGARTQATGLGSRFFIPSAGAAYGRGPLRLRASAYRSFRAPTLNELYRDFRAGNALTQANAELQPETLTGGEAGIDLSGESRRLSFTAFHNALDNLITNVTLVSTPQQITRQRRNAAAALARGIEADVRQRLPKNINAEASYLFIDSRFRSNIRVPQVARHQGFAQLTFHTLAFGIRANSSQFEDDRNLRSTLMGGFATLHLTARRRLTRHLHVGATIENLLNRQYITAFTPTPNTASPLLLRLHIKFGTEP